MPVSHEHGAVLGSGEALEQGIRALKISLLLLLLTSILQGFIAILGGSAALLADTLHNLADALTALPLWVAFALGRRQASRRFTYGYNRAQDVVGVLIVLVILASGGVAAWESLRSLAHRRVPTHLELGLAAGVLGFLGNELVAQYKIRVGERIGSAALKAEGQHSRVDGLASLGVVVGLGGVWLGYPLLDPLAGLAITAFILWVGAQSGGEILARMMDAIDPETIQQAERLAQAVEGVRGVDRVRARWVGNEIFLDLTIYVDGERTIREGHAVAARARDELRGHLPRVTDVVIHVDPFPLDGQQPPSGGS